MLFEQIMLADFRPPYLGGQVLAREAIPDQNGYLIPWNGLNCAVNAYVRYQLNVPGSSGLKAYLDSSAQCQTGLNLFIEEASEEEVQTLFDSRQAAPSKLLQAIISDAGLCPFREFNVSEKGIHFIS